MVAGVVVQVAEGAQEALGGTTAELEVATGEQMHTIPAPQQSRRLLVPRVASIQTVWLHSLQLLKRAATGRLDLYTRSTA